MDHSGVLLSDLPKPPAGRHGWPWDVSFNFADRRLAHGVMPKVVIVTPSFNQAAYIEETIRSVILQGYSNLEYWVIDGGSTDGTKSILEKYDPWLAGWRSEPDRGQTDAINKVWGTVSGDFYGWLNSDDIFTPGALYNLISYFKQHPDIDYVYGELEIINEKSEIVGSRKNQLFDLKKLVREAGWISQPGSLISGGALKQVGLLDPELRLLMDLDLWFRAGKHYKFGKINAPLARYRKHAATKTKTQQSRAAQEIMHVYDKVFSAPDLPSEIRAIRSYAYASAHIYAAHRLLNSGNLPDALSQMRAAIKSDARVVFRSRFWGFPRAVIVAWIRGAKASRTWK